MKSYIDYYNKLFILWFNIYILKQHNLSYSKLKYIKFNIGKRISLIVHSLFFSFVGWTIYIFLRILFIKSNNLFYLDLFCCLFIFLLTLYLLFYLAKEKILHTYDYNLNDHYGLAKQLLNKCIYVNNKSTHNQINLEIKQHNLECYKLYKKRINDYYLDEKSKIMSPKEKKEILNYFKS